MQPDLRAEILARLNAAVGPDPILDLLVKMLLDPPPGPPQYDDIAALDIDGQAIRVTLKQQKDGKPYYGYVGLQVSLPVTASMDANSELLSKIRPNWQWIVRANHGDFYANISSPECYAYNDMLRVWEGHYDAPGCRQQACLAMTPALAMLAALLEVTEQASEPSG